MKKIWNKIESNKFLFTIFMVISFFLFILLTNGFHGVIIEGWYGITPYLGNLSRTTDSGQSIFYEVIWFMCLIPVLLLFNNKYILHEKHMSLKKTLVIIWPLLLLTTCIGIFYFGYAGGFKYFNFDEVIASIFLFTFVGIFEEFLCRGWLQNEFIERFGNTRKGVFFSILISGILFGAIHIINYFGGQPLGTTLVQMTSAMIIGFYFGIVYFRTKNIWVTVILHGFWDLALSLGNMNVTTSCVNTVALEGISMAILGLVVAFLLDLPSILVTIKEFSKTHVNESLDEEHKIVLDDKQINNDKTLHLVLTIIIAIYSGIMCLFFFVIGIIFIFVGESDSCMNYEVYETDKTEMVLLNYKDYEIKSSITSYVDCMVDSVDCIDQVLIDEYKLTFSIKDNEFIVNNDNDSYTFDIDDVEKFAIFENNDGGYTIMVLATNNKNGIVYLSKYLDNDVIDDKDLFEKLDDSFEAIALPSISNIGYFDLNNKYPLFKTDYNTYYVMVDGNPMKLSIK
ncbi:MAG: CPBP family intramembrane metalloprotease [Bacilli bacterium]|nr:CPBP family intramembrane metalloprotease [Bacilli bacterium]